jgi:hypothetical protein
MDALGDRWYTLSLGLTCMSCDLDSPGLIWFHLHSLRFIRIDLDPFGLIGFSHLISLGLTCTHSDPPGLMKSHGLTWAQMCSGSRQFDRCDAPVNAVPAMRCNASLHHVSAMRCDAMRSLRHGDAMRHDAMIQTTRHGAMQHGFRRWATSGDELTHRQGHEL